MAQDWSVWGRILSELGRPLVMVDEGGLIRAINREAQETLGPEAVLGAGLARIWPGLWTEAEAIILTREADKIEVDSPTGEELVVALTPVQNDQGVIEAVVCGLNRSAPGRGAPSPELEALLSSSHDGLWLIDRNETVVRVNQGVERIHELDPAELIGKSIDQLSAMEVMDRSVTREVFKHRTSLTINQRLPRLNKDILVTATPVFDDTGELKFVVVVDRDVTELNRLKKELEASRSDDRADEAPLLGGWSEDKGWDIRTAVARLETEIIMAALQKFGSQRKAAVHLGIDQSTLARKAHKHGIRREVILHRKETG